MVILEIAMGGRAIVPGQSFEDENPASVAVFSSEVGSVGACIRKWGGQFWVQLLPAAGSAVGEFVFRKGFFGE